MQTLIQIKVVQIQMQRAYCSRPGKSRTKDDMKDGKLIAQIQILIVEIQIQDVVIQIQQIREEDIWSRTNKERR